MTDSKLSPLEIKLRDALIYADALLEKCGFHPASNGRRVVREAIAEAQSVDGVRRAINADRIERERGA